MRPTRKPLAEDYNHEHNSSNSQDNNSNGAISNSNAAKVNNENISYNQKAPEQHAPSHPPVQKRPRIIDKVYSDRDQQGPRSVEMFELIGQIGEGTYGQVYKARDSKSNEIVALKKVRLENEKEGFPITAVMMIAVARARFISHVI